MGINSPEEKSRICLAVLRALPEWFGVEAAILGYAVSVKALPFFVAQDGTRDVGFIALQRNTPSAMEIHVMGVLKAYQRQGIGMALLSQAEWHGREAGAEFLTVKTLDESVSDEFYAKTRRFYLGAGFRPLEVFPLHWNKENPCLFMAKWLRGADAT